MLEEKPTNAAAYSWPAPRSARSTKKATALGTKLARGYIPQRRSSPTQKAIGIGAFSGGGPSSTSIDPLAPST